MDLTPQQQAACLHVRDSEKNLAVRARAGSGKTTLLKLLTRQISSREKAMAVAFNKSIAEELKTGVPRHVDVKTLHGLGFGAIQRAWGRKLETDSQRQRSYAREVVPESPQWSKRAVVGTVCKLVSLAMGQLATTPERVAEVMFEYGVLPDRGVQPEQYVGWAVTVIGMSRRETSAISFDDMVFLPAIENVATGAYDVVFFDEAQDGNPAQTRLILNAVRRGGKVVIVGDDRQAIYRWRGAGAGAFDSLVQELKADVLPLTWTFRCPTRVVALAKCLVPDLEPAPNAPRGNIVWDSEQSFYEHVRPGEAVIARSNAALTKACMQILRRGVRAKVAGRDFGEALGGIVDRADTPSVVKFLDWLTPWVTEESERLVAAGKDDKAEELADSAEALRILSEGMRSTSDLRNKLDELFVEQPGADSVRLSTVHRAKGLQWGRVWMLESSFRLNSEEGENLYYVAVTRVLGPNAAGELRLVQNALKGGKIPNSIAEDLLGRETLDAWDEEERGVLSPEEEAGEEGWGDR